MNSIGDTALNFNPYVKFNFDGGNLSSDGRLLLVREFATRIGLHEIVRKLFQTKDTSKFRLHTDPDNLLQLVYQTIGGYPEDDRADDIKDDPVFTTILGKPTLASQPTISHFLNRTDDDTLGMFDDIEEAMRTTIHGMEEPEHVLFDLDSTLLDTYGSQEGEAFNYHYQAHGYHPLLCFNGLNGDL